MTPTFYTINNYSVLSIDNLFNFGWYEDRILVYKFSSKM